MLSLLSVTYAPWENISFCKIVNKIVTWAACQTSKIMLFWSMWHVLFHHNRNPLGRTIIHFIVAQQNYLFRNFSVNNLSTRFSTFHGVTSLFFFLFSLTIISKIRRQFCSFKYGVLKYSRTNVVLMKIVIIIRIQLIIEFKTLLKRDWWNPLRKSKISRTQF